MSLSESSPDSVNWWQALPLPLTIVDLETTGGRAPVDRITEIGLIEVDEKGVREWSQLVNPECRIPAHIEKLTGISNTMVADAPRFADISEALFERLKGRLFIAHNARFDYGFLRNEFARVGRRLSLSQLCTVKLSRKLYPESPRHGLDALIARHQLSMQSRHRALDDARAVWHFLEAAQHEQGSDALCAAIAYISRRPTLPPWLDERVIDELPEGPGVYFFYGEDDSLLYIGKSKNIRTRVLAHFASDHASTKEMRLCQQTRTIRWESCAGEFSALLREARLVKERQPLHNRMLRRQLQLCSLQLQEDERGLLQPVTVFAHDLQANKGGRSRLYGLFASPTAAKKSLRDITDSTQLCHYATGLERPSKRPCSARQLKRCRGYCEGLELPVSHNLRLMQALENLALKVWPYQGPIGLREDNPDANLTELHIIDHWCWLGTARDEQEAADILAQPQTPVFDRDIYKLLVSALHKGSGVTLVALKLPAASHNADE